MPVELGDVYPITLETRNGSKELTDTSSVSVTVYREYDGTTSAPISATRLGLGTYSVDYLTSATGLHIWTATVSGDVTGTFEDVFTVEAPAAPSMVGLAELKTYLGIEGTSDDEQLRQLALVASDACESVVGTGRTWRRTAVTGEQHWGGKSAIQLGRAPVLSVTAVSESGRSLVADDYVLDRETGLLYRGSMISGWPWYPGRLNITVDYIAGATSVPPLVRQGVKDMVQHLWMLPHHGADAMPRGEGYQWSPSMGYLIPNRVATAWAGSRIGGFA